MYLYWGSNCNREMCVFILGQELQQGNVCIYIGAGTVEGECVYLYWGRNCIGGMCVFILGQEL